MIVLVFFCLYTQNEKEVITASSFLLVARFLVFLNQFSSNMVCLTNVRITSPSPLLGAIPTHAWRINLPNQIQATEIQEIRVGVKMYNVMVQVRGRFLWKYHRNTTLYPLWYFMQPIEQLDCLGLPFRTPSTFDGPTIHCKYLGIRRFKGNFSSSQVLTVGSHLQVRWDEMGLLQVNFKIVRQKQPWSTAVSDVIQLRLYHLRLFLLKDKKQL